MNEEIGSRMRAARIAVFGNGSQGHLAHLMQVSQSDVSRWETGKRVPSVVDFVRFARACGVTPEKILAGVAPASMEQLSLGDLDARAAETVRGLVVLLRQRSPAKRARRAS
jgi:transcriptional regulator with XRE-family HTH domain